MNHFAWPHRERADCSCEEKPNPAEERTAAAGAMVHEKVCVRLRSQRMMSKALLKRKKEESYVYNLAPAEQRRGETRRHREGQGTET